MLSVPVSESPTEGSVRSAGTVSETNTVPSSDPDAAPMSEADTVPASDPAACGVDLVGGGGALWSLIEGPQLKATVRKLRALLDDKPLTRELTHIKNPWALVCLLRHYLCELPEPLFLPSAYDSLVTTAECVRAAQLPPARLRDEIGLHTHSPPHAEVAALVVHSLSAVLRNSRAFGADFSRESDRLALVGGFCLNVLRPGEGVGECAWELPHAARALLTLVEHADVAFPRGG